MKTKHRTGSKGWTGPKLPHDLTEQIVAKINVLSPSLKGDWLKEQILTKFVSRETAPQETRSQAGLRKWLAAERENEATSDRLLLTPPDYQILSGVELSEFIEFCNDCIVDIIGDTPSTDALVGAFSGGASTSRGRTESQPARKYLGKADVTAELERSGILELCSETLDAWPAAPDASLRDRRCVLWNVMFTVPKKTDEDRVAAKEPDLNMFLQKGVGNFFRTSLRRVGIDLNDQSINRSLALRGSIDGSLATLDLSKASDSVSTELVFQMLPICWYTLLDSLRSQYTLVIGGEEHRNHMFSSMGNGFTFELESLLFYTLMRATAYFTGTRGSVSVYGDDLIIPTEMAEDAIRVLSFFGFEVNSEKSFWSGHFRESCGGHYYKGLDVTPFYIRGPVESIPDLIHVANQLRKWGELRIGGELVSSIIDPEVEEIWYWLKSLVPEYLWGGGNLSFKYQLVSNDVAHSRIVEETTKRNTGAGGYYHWLNATWGRTPDPRLGDPRWCTPADVVKVFNHPSLWDEPVVTSSYREEVGRLRVRSVRHKTVPRLEAYFHKEVCGDRVEHP